MIRDDELKDLNTLVKISKLFYDEMNFDDIGYVFDENVIRGSYLKGIMFPKNYVILVHLTDNIIDGVIFCVIQDTTMYFKGKLFAQEIVWHSDPSLNPMKRIKIQKELLEEADKVRLERGCKSFYINSDPRYPALEKLLVKKGFKTVSKYHHKGV